MGEYAVAIITTLVLTGLFSYILIGTNIEAIKGDWANRRCEFPNMVMAPFLKPNDVTKSAMEFAMDNFSFCTQQGIQSVLKTAFTPLYSVAGKQSSALNTLSGPLNSIRASLKKGIDTFAVFMDSQLRKYNLINATIVKTWHHLLFAFGRMQSVFYSVVYIGLALNTLIENTLNFTYRAILIFIGIMAALIILLFFVLIPVLPLIITTITILVAAGVGAAAGFSGVFCVDPDALVRMADGSTKQLKSVQVGDHLASLSSKHANIVTGVLEAESSKTPLVSIEGILMSGSHRVKFGDKWILAERHPNARLRSIRLPRLICLNTTQHEVVIVNNNGYELAVGDWEEVSDDEGRKSWIRAVHEQLNPKSEPLQNYPTAIPLASSSTNVIEKNKGKVPIASIGIGDYILTSNETYTRVNGIYKGQIQINGINQIDPEWISDGVWIQSEHGVWSTADGLKEDRLGNHTLEGVFLITEEESFLIQHKDSMKLVRDFTEIGASRIDSTYEMLDAHINKK
jgi:hypothetical protein